MSEPEPLEVVVSVDVEPLRRALEDVQRGLVEWRDATERAIARWHLAREAQAENGESPGP